jgi:hypothetical protein
VGDPVRKPTRTARQREREHQRADAKLRALVGSKS